MSAKTGKRAGGSAGAKSRKPKRTPKFLLVKDADAEEAQGTVLVMDEVDDSVPAVEEPRADEDWPEREGIRDGLVDQVSTRFGISQDVAIRAVNDMLRLS